MKVIMTLLKAIVLTGLIVISIMQTSKLWFDDDSDRNFFYSVIPRGMLLSNIEVKDPGNLIEPEQFAVYFARSDIEYSVVKKGASSYDNILTEMVELASYTLTGSNYMSEVEDITMLWEKPHIMLKLPIVYDHAMVEENLALPRNSLEKAGRIQTLIIVPAFDNEPNIKIYVENYDTKIYHQYNASAKDVNVKLSNELITYFLTDMATSVDDAGYVSSLKNNISYFDNNVLLPLPSEGIKYHDVLYMNMPFDNAGRRNVEAVETYVGHFFNNPEIIDGNEMENLILFTAPTEETIKVRYLNNGLIHYKRSLINEPAYADVSLAISAASRFIDRDLEVLPGEYHLKEYIITDDYVALYYDMAFNDYEITLSDELMAYYKLEKPYPLSVVVSEDEVVEFKRILVTVDEFMPQDRILEARYQDTLDRFIEEIGSTDVVIKDIYLGYNWEAIDKELDFHWIIETQNSTYTYEIP